MTSPPARRGSLTDVRTAVRAVLVTLPPGAVLVACSGGADSLALAAATAAEAAASGHSAAAVVVDHGLLPESADVASRAAEQCRALGLDPVAVHEVHVTRARGPEAAARSARYAALRAASSELSGAPVLLGHTRDDQAEQVLLALARGSGARSLSGMPRARPPFHRPLLGLARSATRAACQEAGLAWWDDPANQDPAYLRVRVRELLPLIEERLGPGVVAGLVRSADLLRDDADLLDELADRAVHELAPGPVPAAALTGLPRAVRTRVWRRLAVAAGSPAGSLFSVHVAALDALVTGWKGQGPVDLPGGIRAWRSGGRVSFGQGPGRGRAPAG